jgi:hypothetical protein
VSQSCKESLEFELEGDQIEIDEALNSPENIQALLNSCYDIFANIMNGRVQNIHELLGDNLSQPENSAGSLYFTIYNRGTFSFRTADGLLSDLYQTIYRTNILLENLDRFETELDVPKMSAESRFIRAWSHWEIAKIWAHPYGYTADNSHKGIAVRLESAYNVELRSPLSEVYATIIEDLKASINDLPDAAPGYATKDAAKALLAKVYFTMNDFANAQLYAQEVINTNVYTLDSTVDRFTPEGASETIFMTVSTGTDFINNRAQGLIQNYRSDNNPNPVLKPSKDLVSLFGDTADQRSAWVETMEPGLPTEFYLCHKYDKDFFSVPLLTVTELYLIAAESILELGGDRQTAADYVNVVRTRAYRGNTDNNLTATTVNISEVRTERRKEFCFEGLRTPELKRRGAKGEQTVIRQAPWDCPGLVLQYPASEKTEGFEMNEEGSCE